MIRLLSLAALALILNGCLVTVESDTDSVETVWSDSDVSRLELGSSDEQWVRSSFGEPASKLSYAEHRPEASQRLHARGGPLARSL